MTHDQNATVRVLHVVTNMSYGGLENLLMNYYRNMDRSKIQFDFLTHVDIHQDFEEEIAALGGRLYRLPRLNPFSIGYRRQLRRFFTEHPEYRIVHSHLDCLSAIPLKAARQAEVPVRIAHSHTSSLVRNWKMLVKYLYRPLISRYATDLFACGDKAGDWMFRGIPYTIVNNAIDAAAFRFELEISQQVRQELGLGNSLTMGHVGQFRTEKNHLFLIDIFNAVLKKHPDSRLMLVGKGQQMEPAIQKADALGIRKKILFLGARSDISELMQAMDVFVLPSLYEGMPVTIIEAQAAGLPCLISDKVPIECKKTELVTQLPLEADATVWADAILSAAKTPRSDTLSQIREAGFDIQANAEWLADFYLSAYRKEA